MWWVFTPSLLRMGTQLSVEHPGPTGLMQPLKDGGLPGVVEEGGARWCKVYKTPSFLENTSVLYCCEVL